MYCTNPWPCTLKGIVTVLAKQPAIEIAGQATSADTMLADLTPLPPYHWPDVIILEANIPPMGGIDALLKLVPPDNCHIVIFDNDANIINALRFFQMRIKNYIQASIEPDAFVSAIRHIAAGNTYLHLSEDSKKKSH